MITLAWSTNNVPGRLRNTYRLPESSYTALCKPVAQKREREREEKEKNKTVMGTTAPETRKGCTGVGQEQYISHCGVTKRYSQSYVPWCPKPKMTVLVMGSRKLQDQVRFLLAGEV
jgi:hypothetical protein